MYADGLTVKGFTERLKIKYPLIYRFIKLCGGVGNSFSTGGRLLIGFSEDRPLRIS